MQSNKLYVGNLSYSVTDKQLEELFSQHGQIKQANVIGNKGFGFVEMSDASEAEKAKEALDGTTFEGRTLKVDEARPQRERTDSSYRRY
ncbi:MAG: RNA-binding protein [Actinobacteria bacterium RBG_13_35_12]|jgi:RNA recognition motif-containing protein|nr:MAG: RNA-binding protein [Actinobacteria bacterium RBG_13_35_12]